MNHPLPLPNAACSQGCAPPRPAASRGHPHRPGDPCSCPTTITCPDGSIPVLCLLGSPSWIQDPVPTSALGAACGEAHVHTYFAALCQGGCRTRSSHVGSALCLYTPEYAFSGAVNQPPEISHFLQLVPWPCSTQPLAPPLVACPNPISMGMLSLHL